MGRNSGHNSKSKAQRDFYTKYIKEQNYEPTIDESLSFDNSNNKEEDFSLQRAPRKRRESNSEIFKRHFSENWLTWLVSVIGISLFYFFVTFQLNLSKIDSKSNENEKDISNLDSKIDKEVNKKDSQIEKLEDKIEIERDKNQQQDLKIQKNTLTIDSKKKK